MQIRGLPRFFRLIRKGIRCTAQQEHLKTITSIQALFTAMATTIGIGNVVGPSLAIVIGGPGSLFWIICYAFIGSATKFTEVTFALFARKKTETGEILGGPMQYLKLISSAASVWYGLATVVMFAIWSGTQANTLAKILAREGIVEWQTGIGLAFFLLAVLWGGAQRVGAFASKLVPLMFVLYVAFALFIIAKDLTVLKDAIALVFQNIFTPAAAVGGFLGATVFEALKAGVYKSVFITEAGTGTSSIPHSLANVERPTDQGILALYSMAADAFLCTLSGLLILVTGVWQSGVLSSTLVYEAFKMNSPIIGRFVLVISISLFALTTVIGNSFNGSQMFATFTRYRWLKIYYCFAALLTFLGAISDVPAIWAATDLVLTFVAIPNLVCLVLLAFKYPDVLKIK